MKSADYNNQLFKQVQDLIDKCDSLSADMKRERKEHKKEINDLKARHVKEIHELRTEHKKEITELSQRVEMLEVENTKLKNDNDRLKKIINNDSNNSSKPPSSDIKKNILNNREKTNKKAGGQIGHKAHFLSKKSIEETGILNNFTGNLVHDHETVMYNYGDKHVECTVHISRYLKQEEKSLLNRLKKYKENHLIFLYDFSVPFDNNLSEGDLRHIKLKQKISGHFNSFEGLEIYSNIKSIIGTLKKIGKEFYILINNVFENIPVSI